MLDALPQGFTFNRKENQECGLQGDSFLLLFFSPQAL